jgi:hypothetical protein
MRALCLFIDDFVPSDAVKENVVGFQKLEYDADVVRDGEGPQILQSARELVRV